MCNILPIITESNLCNASTNSDDLVNTSDIIDTQNIK
jgi:hypothetical protein